MLVVGHPTDAARILDNQDDAFPDKGGNTGFRRISVPFLGGGLSTWNAMDPEWRRRRLGLSRLFRAPQSKGFDLSDLIGVDGDGLRLAIEQRIVVDVISKLLMVSPPAGEVIAVTGLLRKLAATFWSTKVPGPHPFVSAKVRRAKAALELIVQSWLNSSREDSPIRHYVRDLGDVQLRDEVLSQLLSVGTLAVPAEWALQLLAASPSVQDALRLSLANHDDEYLTWTARETLRLCPSTYWIQRRVGSHSELSGTAVSPGDRVLIHVPRVHRHPDFWTESERFLPERFGNDSDWRRAWMPFGRGARLCVGHAYSLDIIKSVIKAVVIGHVVGEANSHVATLVTGFSLIPRRNPSLIFTPV